MGRLIIRRSGFTLVELLTVVILVSVLASIAIPKFSNTPLRSREANLKHNLKLIREAEDRCEADTGLVVPITALASRTAPSTGWPRGPMGVLWYPKSLKASDWRGPYLSSIPVNPFSGNATVTINSTTHSPTVAWTASSGQAFNSSFVYYPSTTISSEGTPYRTW
jgi:prepilin-type N-terminal cleavage/methylation domain-containing protein